MANISFFAKIFAISLLWLLSGPISLAYGLGDSIDMDLYAMEEAEKDEEDEYEALVMELNALGLSFDSPEVQGMYNGDMWRFIEEMEKQEATSAVKLIGIFLNF